MSMIQSDLLLGQEGGAGYAISRSLRFNSSDSAYLSRTPASAGNRKTWTWAGWVKRSALQSGTSNTYMQLFSAGTSAGSRDVFFFDTDTDDTLAFYSAGGGIASGIMFRTNAVFRDASAWMHLMLAVDTTQATAANRVKLYINGVEQTFSTVSYPSQNAEGFINLNNAHYIATHPPLGEYFSGYLADVIFIDGQQLTPSSLVETSATTGQLIPKAYTGTYGTNGFWLKFSDNSAATATTLGKDYSGNSNNWTPNNLSVTAGAGNDSLVDTPTSYGTDTGAGGEVKGNYATLNPISLTAHTLSNGNLDVTSSALGIAVGTVGMSSGKWYWECTLNSVSANVSPAFGYINQAFNTATAGTTYLGSDSNSGGVRRDNGQAFQNNTSTSYTGAAGFVANDVAIFAFDADAKKLWIGKNGTWYNSGVPASGTGNIPLTITGTTFFPAFNTYGDSYSVNFGQRPFAYTAPSGFKALCDTNLPAPVVAQPSTVMDVKLWNGNSSTQNIAGLAFSPDLAWVKGRTGTLNHVLSDTIRGANLKLASNTTAAEAGTDNGTISAFNSDGITVAMGTGAYPGYETNLSGYSYVGWFWDAGSSTVTNTQGSITTSLRALPSSGFSVATWSGTGSGSVTVGHGLGVAPRFMIIKDRSLSRNWLVYHTSLGASSGLVLNSTNAASGTDGGWWNHTAPTSTVATIGTYGNEASNYVGYFWAPVNGYSSFGSYTGNGTANDGPFVYTGFKPKWVMVKCSSAGTTAWTIWDAQRPGYNVANLRLRPNSSEAEQTDGFNHCDFLSNGFKVRGSAGSDSNTSSATYIYCAFAESPFQYARAR